MQVRAAHGQQDLTPVTRKSPRFIYMRGTPWSFHTAKTLSRPCSDWNPALQRAPDLILANAVCCPRSPWLGGRCNSIDWSGAISSRSSAARRHGRLRRARSRANGWGHARRGAMRQLSIADIS